MKNQFLIQLAIFLTITVGSFCIGYSYRQKEVLENAQRVFKQDKIVYDVQDLEIIIFNEVQE
jgi:hypothetical protein